jgi:hypothetical protein
MYTPDFVLETVIHTPLERLHAFLCDLHNYVPLHPLIDSIEPIPPRDDLPDARHFRVVDRIPFGPFRLRTVYTAALESVSEREVRGHARQSPGVRLLTIYHLEEVASGTRLVEEVTVEAPRILRRFVISQARKSHQETLGKMKLLLEGE